LTEQLKARGIYPSAKYRKDDLVLMLNKADQQLAAKAERPAVSPADADDGAAGTPAEPAWSKAGRRGRPPQGVRPSPQSVRPSSDPVPTLQQLSQWTLVKLKEVCTADCCLRRALYRLWLIASIDHVPAQ